MSTTKPMPSQIGVGSIVVRFANDGTGLDIAQIMAADATLPPGRRWVVLHGGKAEQWHSATILRTMRDWEEVEFTRGAMAAVKAMVRAMALAGLPEGVPAQVARPVLEDIARGLLKP